MREGDWEVSDIADLVFYRRDKHMTFKAIGSRLDRSESSCSNKYYALSTKELGPRVRKNSVCHSISFRPDILARLDDTAAKAGKTRSQHLNDILESLL